MDAMQAILTRRSIRAYTDRPVPEELIEQLLRAAMAAPSAGNFQPWRFVVIDERAILDAIPEFHAWSAMLRQAPVAIAICADTAVKDLGPYWPQDCSAATQNMLLAAHSAGLGAVWLGIHPEEDRIVKMRQLLGMPETLAPFCVVAVGWPAEEPGPADRYDPARARRNRWG